MVTRSSERIFKPMRYTGRKPICMEILEKIILINKYNIYKKRIV